MRVLIGLFLCSALLGAHAAVNWQPVMPGIASARLKGGLFGLHSAVIAYRVNPQRYHFKLAFAKPAAFVRELAKRNHALLAINGGYFSTDFQPLGLRLSESQRVNERKAVSWWGIFYWDGQQPHIVANHAYPAADPAIHFALQAGPRLLDKGRVLPLKAGKAQRSAICIDDHQQVIFAITKNHALTLDAWAKRLRQFHCVDALNLDGGSSSQLYTDLPRHNAVVNNYKPVTDAILLLDNSAHHHPSTP